MSSSTYQKHSASSPAVVGNDEVHELSSGGRPTIALVAHGIHDSGGMERACAELIRRMSNEVRFVVIATDFDPELSAYVSGQIRIRAPGRPIALRFIVFFVQAAYALRKIDSDLVHTVGAIVPSHVDVAAVHYCHAGARRALGSFAPGGGPMHRRLNTSLARGMALAAERWCYRPSRIRCLAPVSSGVAEELLVSYGNVPRRIVPNGVDTGRFRADLVARSSLRQIVEIDAEDIVVLFVGGDWYRKGLAVAIEAVAAVHKEGVPIWLWVVGTGDERRFRNLAAGVGFEGRVRFFGHRADTERFFQSADIFVLPTRYETFSIVAYEAAACGLPVVATPVSGVSELIGDDEAGIVVSNDAGTVAMAITSLVQNPEGRRAMGREGCRRVNAFTWDATAEAMKEVYESLLVSDGKCRKGDLSAGRGSERGAC